MLINECSFPLKKKKKKVAPLTSKSAPVRPLKLLPLHPPHSSTSLLAAQSRTHSTCNELLQATPRSTAKQLPQQPILYIHLFQGNPMFILFLLCDSLSSIQLIIFFHILNVLTTPGYSQCESNAAGRDLASGDEAET